MSNPTECIEKTLRGRYDHVTIYLEHDGIPYRMDGTPFSRTWDIHRTDGNKIVGQVPDEFLKRADIEFANACARWSLERGYVLPSCACLSVPVEEMDAVSYGTWVGKNLQQPLQYPPKIVFDRKFANVPACEDDFFEIVHHAPLSLLVALGFRRWSRLNTLIENNKRRGLVSKFSTAPTEVLAEDADIWMFPYEWYGVIPKGFMLSGTIGESYPFLKSRLDDGNCFGCLAYGIRRPVEG